MVLDSFGTNDGMLAEPWLSRRKIKAPMGRVLENENTSWDRRALLVVSGEKVGIRTLTALPVNEEELN